MGKQDCIVHLNCTDKQLDYSPLPHCAMRSSKATYNSYDLDSIGRQKQHKSIAGGEAS